MQTSALAVDWNAPTPCIIPDTAVSYWDANFCTSIPLNWGAPIHCIMPDSVILRCQYLHIHCIRLGCPCTLHHARYSGARSECQLEHNHKTIPLYSCTLIHERHSRAMPGCLLLHIYIILRYPCALCHDIAALYWDANLCTSVTLYRDEPVYHNMLDTAAPFGDATLCTSTAIHWGVPVHIMSDIATPHGGAPVLTPRKETGIVYHLVIGEFYIFHSSS